MVAVPALLSALALLAGPWPVPNGDAEQLQPHGQPVAWRSGTNDGGDYSFVTPVEDGNRFLRIVGRKAEGRAHWSQLLPACPPPRAFRVTIRYRGTTSGIDGFVRFRDAADTSREVSVYRWEVRPNRPDWTTHEQTFPVAAAVRQQAAVRPEIIIYGRGVGTVDYDDLTLTIVDDYQPTWAAAAPDPRRMRWCPADKHVAQQNPPDFRWPAVEGADGYRLELAREADFQTVVQAAEPVDNFHNFDRVFEPGVWYWRVRFRTADAWSAWSDIRRLRIDPDAWPWPVPSLADLERRVPATHPRIWTTAATLAAFRARAEGPRQEWFANVHQAVLRDLAKPPAPEPSYAFQPGVPFTAEIIAAHNKLRGEGEGAASRVLRHAFDYLISRDEAVGRSAVAQLVNLASWDPNGPTGYATHDQVHRAIAYRGAMAYDWVHDLLTPAQREAVLAMIRARTNTMFRQLAQSRPLKVSPYDSHGWTAFGYIGIIALATYGDLPEAAEWFRAVVPTYLNLCPPWGGEDGGWCQGTSYWSYSQSSNKAFYDCLESAVGCSPYGKAFDRHNVLFPLYFLPAGAPRGHFGDGEEMPAQATGVHYRRLAQVHRDPIAQWGARSLGDRLTGSLEDYFYGDDTVPVRPPVALPRGRWFRDIGWVAMHSDLADPQRVSGYFKSSSMGSFNHSHADQNSFLIDAFGEALAIDSGYYDWYGSPHHRLVAQQTISHNAITVDGGEGQPIQDITASGEILGFVTSPRLDATTGDATAAYQGRLAKAVRHVIYLRPTTFVVIDDLAAPTGRPTRFEWRLHGLTSITPQPQGAVVRQGQAELDVRLAAPADLTYEQRTTFLAPPGAAGDQAGTAIRPQGRGDAWADQVHAAFATAPTAATRFVATLEARRVGETPPPAALQQNAAALRLTWPDGRLVAVRLGAGEVTSGPLRFDGAVAALDGTARLLVEGRRLAVDGQPLLESDGPITAAVDGGYLCVSARDDTVARLRAPGTTKVRDHRDRPLPADRWRVDGEWLELRLEPGSWAFYLNETPAPGPVGEVTVPRDGGAPLRLEAWRGVDGVTTAWGTIESEPGLHEVRALPAGLTLGSGLAVGARRWLGAREEIALRGEATGSVSLRRLDPESLTVQVRPAGEQPRPDGALEAEQTTATGGGSFSRYTNRPFLSGGTGLGTWEAPGQVATWSLTVPRAGRYDLLLKAATHVGAQRVLALGDCVGRFEVAPTGGFGATPAEWQVVRVALGLTLPAGPTDLAMWCANGLLNLDWLALAPAP